MSHIPFTGTWEYYHDNIYRYSSFPGELNELICLFIVRKPTARVGDKLAVVCPLTFFWWCAEVIKTDRKTCVIKFDDYDNFIYKVPQDSYSIRNLDTVNNIMKSKLDWRKCRMRLYSFIGEIPPQQFKQYKKRFKALGKFSCHDFELCRLRLTQDNDESQFDEVIKILYSLSKYERLWSYQN